MGMKRRMQIARKYYKYFAPLFILGLTALLFQNCSRVAFLNSTPTILNSLIGDSVKSYGGEVYDGKLILHHYVDGFQCEGRAQPESILIRNSSMNWFLIQNSTTKCAKTDQLSVVGVVYNEDLKEASFNAKTYMVPRAYNVDASEDPNLPDIKIEDGVCETINGKCSLLAAVQSANSINSFTDATVNIPPGTYLMKANFVDSLVVNGGSWALPIETVESGYSVNLKGAAVATTILDGQGLTSLVKISGLSSANQVITISGLTFQSGQSTASTSGSAITVNAPMHLASVNILDCLFQGNQGNPALYAGFSTGRLNVSNSKFYNNHSGIYIDSIQSGLIENVAIDHSDSGFGINVSNFTPDLKIINTVVYNSLGGINLRDCFNCVLDGVSISASEAAGLQVVSFLPRVSASSDVTINNSYISGNGRTFGYNLVLMITDPLNAIIVNNSTIAVVDFTKKNCNWMSSPRHNMKATNSTFDRIALEGNSCEPVGTNLNFL
jgi:hypothetical protein